MAPGATACWSARVRLKREREAFRQRLLANPANYIAQDTLALSTCPTFVDEGLSPRHIDLRPYVLSGQEMRLVPGGLTRVAPHRRVAGGQPRRRAAEPRIPG